LRPLNLIYDTSVPYLRFVRLISFGLLFFDYWDHVVGGWKLRKIGNHLPKGTVSHIGTLGSSKLWFLILRICLTSDRC